MYFPREQSTNNTAEYEGLLGGLRIVADLRIRKLVIRGDSQLVVRQVNKDYQSLLMEAYVEEVRKLEERFDRYKQSTSLVLKILSLTTCLSVQPLSYLWNQGLSCYGSPNHP